MLCIRANPKTKAAFRVEVFEPKWLAISCDVSEKFEIDLFTNASIL